MSPFEWDDYLSLAEELAERDTDEAALRSAISRAYYAVYHRASAHVRVHDVVPVGERLTHRKVWQVLQSGGDQERTDVGFRGRLLHQLRTSADYHRPFPGDLRERAQTAVAEARIVLDLIDRL